MTIYGYYHDVYIEQEFYTNNMPQIDQIANQNNVVVYVTQAYRKDGVPPDGAIVPPSSTSNHLVGHAIDMNLDTPLGWCNGSCLNKAYFTDHNSNPYAYQFIKDIEATGMRWGGVFYPTDPVHIDDGLNLRDMNEWNQLFDEIQPKCNDLDV